VPFACCLLPVARCASFARPLVGRRSQPTVGRLTSKGPLVWRRLVVGFSLQPTKAKGQQGTLGFELAFGLGTRAKGEAKEALY